MSKISHNVQKYLDKSELSFQKDLKISKMHKNFGKINLNIFKNLKECTKCQKYPKKQNVQNFEKKIMSEMSKNYPKIPKFFPK